MLLLDDEKRKNKRRAAYITARVDGRLDKLMSWTEVTPLSDVSALGAAFKIKKAVKPGCLILLTMRMPRDLRGFDFAKDDYSVWSLVRRCKKVDGPDGQPRYKIGVAFIGKNPPADHLENPDAKYELAEKEPRNGFWQIRSVEPLIKKAPVYSKQRRHTRFEIPEEVTLELMNDKGWAIASEMTVTLNISRSGAAVYSQLQADVGSLVRFSSPRNDVRLISIVRGKHEGQAGLSRINLEFIDQPFPID